MNSLSLQVDTLYTQRLTLYRVWLNLHFGGGSPPGDMTLQNLMATSECL